MILFINHNLCLQKVHFAVYVNSLTYLCGCKIKVHDLVFCLINFKKYRNPAKVNHEGQYCSAFMVQFENCMFASQSMHPGNNLKGCSCSSSRSDPYLAWISLLHIKLFSTPCSPTAKILHILKTKLLSIPVYSSPCFLLKIMDLEISWTSFFVGLSNVLIRKSGPSTDQRQLNLMIWYYLSPSMQ